MAPRDELDLYIPQEQTATLQFTKPGPVDPATGKPKEIVALWMKVKADLTFDDRQALFWSEDEMEDDLDADGKPVLDENGKPKKKPIGDEEVRERLAPFVLDWSVGRRGDDGTPEKVPPPAVGGGKQFALISEVYVRKLLMDLRFRSTGKVDSDFLAW